MRIEGVGAIANQFDGMLFDQFGVLHDGRKPYPHAIALLESLKAKDIPVGIITNSGKRAEANRQRLDAMGFHPGLFVDCLSSGEVAFRSLAPQRAFVIGKTGDDYGFDGFTLVDDPKAAQVLLILGSDAPRTSMEDYVRLLQGLSVPAICCNPDKQMLTASGLQPAPGAIAALYEKLGGQVTWIGKPYPAIYLEAARHIGSPRRVLCVGDSAEHDVAGGRAAGFSTLLVMTGISEGLDPAEVEPQPDFWMPQLQW
jgi:HAD superfamily hydrolase (TIGR01459 family)